MKNSRIEVKPSGARLGAEIHNIDLTGIISEEEKETLRQALDQYEVVFFPGQELTPHQQKEATLIFGPLLPSHTFFDHLDDDPEIEVVTNDETNPPTGTARWHADLTWSKEPPGGTSLYSRKLPKSGRGNTIWASMSSAYDGLSDRMKSYLEGLEAIHSWDLLLPGRTQFLARSGEAFLEHKRQNPPIPQPVIRSHPRTGKKILNVNPTFTHHILGLPRLESEGILAFLFSLPARPENQVRHQWQEGTLAVWDNTATQHAAVDDFFPEYRELTRVTFGGHGTPF